MFCMYCGQTLPDGARFCKFCGTPQDAVAPVGTDSIGTPTVPVVPSPIIPNFDNAPKQVLVPAMCPNCSARLNVDPSYKIARCGACGTECLIQDAINRLNVSGSVNLIHSGNVVHSGVVYQKVDHSDDPSFRITYTATIPTIGMTLSIIPGPRNIVFSNGSNQTFNLSPGKYTVKGKVGGFSEKVCESFTREVTIYGPEMPVTMAVGAKPGFLHGVTINFF